MNVGPRTFYSSINDSIRGNRIDKVDHYKKVRRVWILMIVLGPLLMILSGAIFMGAVQPEWNKVKDEGDFRYDPWEEAYETTVGGRLFTAVIFPPGKPPVQKSCYAWIVDED